MSMEERVRRLRERREFVAARGEREFMQREFRLQYVPTTPIPLGNTTIDLTFVRNINISVMPFVSYFSYYRPMVNTIFIDY